MPLIDPDRPAPDFSLPDQFGKIHTLADFKGHPFILYFYPKDDTSGCTAQACDIRDNMAAFTGLECSLVGISPDDVDSHARFAAKFDLPFTLLADTPIDGTPPVCDAYGVWQEKAMYGRTYMGVQRTTYLIGPDGNVLRRWDKVKVPGHIEELLAALR
jgi:thioredoxin-dependent peroxiredoxin